ncbi:hypothetical protein ACFX5U_17730 [Sphingobacterium sp. SG20118]|uniref:hypothetical protein n=1 Tax=Sphingobacterium sp. SG20118 TaxID=3367156 RepID=UPI0037DFC143
MTNNQELLKKIEALTHDSEAGFQINNQKVVEEYQHLKENRNQHSHKNIVDTWNYPKCFKFFSCITISQSVG